MTWANVGWLVVCALLFFASKGAGKLLEGIPGHAGAFWIPILFLARASVQVPGAASMTALMGASLWSFHHGGDLSPVPYLAAALVLDALELTSDRLQKLRWALLGGVVCHLAKYLCHNVPVALLGVSGGFLAWGMLTTASLHALFGLLGGFIGWALLRSPLSNVEIGARLQGLRHPRERT